jgi:hypothetical protein
MVKGKSKVEQVFLLASAAGARSLRDQRTPCRAAATGDAEGPP